MQPASTTLASADATVRAAARRLADAGVDSPMPDSKVLLAWAWGVPPAVLGRYVLRGTEVPAEVLTRFQQALEQRAARRPLQHITGVAPFRHLELSVGPGVFIPRPETERLVDYALDFLASLRRTHEQRLRVIDLCAGSAAIGLAIACETTHVDVHAVEQSPEAAAYAARNIATYRPRLAQVGSTVNLHVADATTWVGEPARVGQTSAVECEPRRGAHLVVCNPPYVAGDITHAPEVLHDPPAALYGGGEAGADLPVKLVNHAATLLVGGGLLIMEHAEYNGRIISDTATRAGFRQVATLGDYTGRDRFTRATWRKDTRGPHI